MAKLQGVKTERIDLEISNFDIVNTAHQLLLIHYGLINQFLSADKKEIREDDPHYHGSVTDHFVRAATAHDVRVFEAASVLFDLTREENLGATRL